MAVKTLKVDLPAEIFDAQASVPLLHQVVVAQLAAARQGTHATKNSRRGSAARGRKPFTVRRAPVAHVRARPAHRSIDRWWHRPRPARRVTTAQRTPKKMKAAALRGALSDRAASRPRPRNY